MPTINAAGTKTYKDSGFEFLLFKNSEIKTLLFAGTAPTTLEIKYTDDEGVDRVFEGGTIATLPFSKIIGPLNGEIKVVSTGGSPNFNITYSAIEENN